MPWLCARAAFRPAQPLLAQAQVAGALAHLCDELALFRRVAGDELPIQRRLAPLPLVSPCVEGGGRGVGHAAPPGRSMTTAVIFS